MASSSNAYLLSDRGRWLSFKNRGDLAILTEGDKRLFNQYGVMRERVVHVQRGAQRWRRNVLILFVGPVHNHK